jgi:hypothetical protein
VQEAVIECYNRYSELTFIGTHLIGCTKEKNHEIFRELEVITTKFKQLTKYNMSPDEFSSIIHFKTKQKKEKKDQGSIFSKTALTWAMDNNDRYLLARLLKLEQDIHKSKKEGLDCLMNNLRNHENLPKILETYKSSYNGMQYCKALRTVVVGDVLLSFIPYIMDIYLDMTLAISYLNYSSESFNVKELWSCGENQLNPSCYERIGSDHATNYLTEVYNLTFNELKASEDIQNNFTVAFWITTFLLLCTIAFYILFIAFDSNPSWLTALLDKINEFMGNASCCKQQNIIWLCFKYFLICVCKLLWPFVFWGRKFLYLATPKHSQYQQNLENSTTIWNNIKIVEHGLESSTQLLLHVWLLRPFLPNIMILDYKELIGMCFSGLANFFTSGMLPACYIEKALAKILLTICFLSLGISLIKRKPGQGLMKTVPIFISIFAQTFGRIVAMTSLVLMTTPWGYYKYALFLVLHFLLVFLIKVVFEVKSLRDKCLACSQSQGWSKRIERVIQFIASGITCTIVMIRLSRDKADCDKKHPSFLSQFTYQGLILLQNLLLVCLPYITDGRYYPTDDCFPQSSQGNSVVIVIVAWIIGAVFQCIHYKYCCPKSPLNGPTVISDNISFLATFCCKKEIQTIEMNLRDVRVHCKDYG